MDWLELSEEKEYIKCPRCGSTKSHLFKWWPYNHALGQHRECLDCEKWFIFYIENNGRLWFIKSRKPKEVQELEQISERKILNC